MKVERFEKVVEWEGLGRLCTWVGVIIFVLGMVSFFDKNAVVIILIIGFLIFLRGLSERVVFWRRIK